MTSHTTGTGLVVDEYKGGNDIKDPMVSIPSEELVIHTTSGFRMESCTSPHRIEHEEFASPLNMKVTVLI